MPGAIIQLVANAGAAQNLWIDHQPQVTLFKCVYRRHTPFAIETIKLNPKSNLDFGSETTFDIVPHGDLLYRLFFCCKLPKISASFKSSRESNIKTLISNSKLSDQSLQSLLEFYASDIVELDKIIETLDSHRKNYVNQSQRIDNQLLYLQDISISINPRNLPENVSNIFLHDLDNEHTVYSTPTISRSKLQTYIGDYLTASNEIYYPMYELVKFIYYSGKYILDSTPILSSTESYSQLENDLFHNLLPDNVFRRTNVNSESIDKIAFYDYLLDVFNRLSCTVPMIFAQILHLNSPINIYQTNIQSKITFKSQWIIDNSYVKSYLLSDNTPYHQFFNANLIDAVASTQRLIQTLFDYYGNIFLSHTDFLFDASNLYSSIYAYVVPEFPQEYSDGSIRPTNVLNINTWYFYFFQYLDRIDASSYSKYISSETPNSTPQIIQFVYQCIILIKLHIEFFMTEISYYMTDLYTNGTSSLKNYVPGTNNSYLGDNFDKLGLSVIFHRSNVPSISEIFQYIYNTIDRLDAENVASILSTTPIILTTPQLQQVKSHITNLYTSIESYFINAHNIIVGLNAPVLNVNPFVVNFFNDESKQNYNQASLSKQARAQMAIIFSLEKINANSTNNLYNRVFDPDTNLQKFGTVAQSIVVSINDYIKSVPKYALDLDPRFTGQSYINTPFQSRNFGKVIAPFDPTTNPACHLSDLTYNNSVEYIDVDWSFVSPVVISIVYDDNINATDWYSVPHYIFLENIDDFPTTSNTLDINNLVESNNQMTNIWNNDNVHYIISKLRDNLQSQLQLYLANEYVFEYANSFFQTNPHTHNYRISDLVYHLTGATSEILNEISHEAYTINTTTLLEAYQSLTPLQQYIFKFLMSLNTRTDIDSSINDIFDSVRGIYVQSIVYQIYDQIIGLLDAVSDYFYRLMSFHRELNREFDLTPSTIPNMTKINSLTVEFKLAQIPDFNTKKQVLQYVRTSYYDTVKNQILKKIKIPILYKYFNRIDAEYYPYIKFFMKYLVQNNIDVDDLYTNFAPQVHFSIDTVGKYLILIMENIYLKSVGADNSIVPKTNSNLKQNSLFDAIIASASQDNILITSLTNHLELSRNQLSLNIDLLNNFTTELANILYRSDETYARSAWIQKLGHYLIESVHLTANNLTLDIHNSNWFECHHAANNNPNQEPSYNKMIGHTPDLYLYHSTVKRASPIVVPFVFSFNRNIATSLPLVSSSHTKYKLVVKLRKLSDLFYHEKYSTYTNSELVHLSDVHLTGEYIYLSAQERSKFATSCLEYLIDEVQTDIQQITNKKTTLKYNFQHPTKYMLMIGQPDIHTNLNLRNSQSDYFYGEKQWSNFGENSFYDCSKIRSIQNDFMTKLYHKLNFSDRDFGFRTGLNMLLYYSTMEFGESPYTINLQILVDDMANDPEYTYINTDSIFSETVINLWNLNIDYDIADGTILHMLIDSILDKLHIADLVLDDILQFIRQNSYLTMTQFIDAIYSILPKSYVDRNVDFVYSILTELRQKYNQTLIIHFAHVMTQHIYLTGNFKYDMAAFNDTYMNLSVIDSTINMMLYMNKMRLTTNPIITETKYFKNLSILLQLHNYVYIGQSIDLLYNNIILIQQLVSFARDLTVTRWDLIENYFAPRISYDKYIKLKPNINPLKKAYICCNGVAIMSKNTTGTMLSDYAHYLYSRSVPKVGLNLHSFALKPFDSQSSGTLNFSKIDRQEIVYKLESTTTYNIVVYACNFNVLVYISGICGKIWS